MEKWFELWDSESANLLGDFNSQEQALVLVRQILGSSSPESAMRLILTSEDGQDSEPEVIAMGQDLINLAQYIAVFSYGPWIAAGNVVRSISGNVFNASGVTEGVRFKQNHIVGSTFASSDEPVSP